MHALFNKKKGASDDADTGVSVNDVAGGAPAAEAPADPEAQERAAALQARATLVQKIKDLNAENKKIRGRLISTDPKLVDQIKESVASAEQRIQEMFDEIHSALGLYEIPSDLYSLKFDVQLLVDEVKKFGKDNKIEESLWKDLKY